ncbi:MAG: type II toxin-antitoxin system RelE/ParE family toxin [Bacteroidota bacterium]
MFEVRQTETYKKWFKTLKDRKARARIDIRIKRISLGNLGDVKSIGKGVFELRIDYGPGYRVYFVERDRIRIILLAGGKKSTQNKDIKKAQELARLVED